MYEAETAPGRRHRWRLWSVVAAVLVLLATAILLMGYRMQRESWPWNAQPNVLYVCGRYFERQEIDTRADITRRGYHLVRHGSGPGLTDRRPLWGYDSQAGIRTDSLDGGCSVLMWMQLSDVDYQVYALEGGP